MKEQNKKTNSFRLMVIGQVISILGASLLRFALDTYVLDVTARADIFALLLAVSTIPGILLSPIGGAIADRCNRRNLMVIFDFTSSLIVLIFSLVLSSGNGTILMIGLTMILLNIISSMYQPAVQASIPQLVNDDNLEKANGIVNGIGSLSNLAGPVLGGVLYSIVGIRMLVVLTCITFFLSAILELFIRIPFEKRPRTAPVLQVISSDMKEGFRFIMKENPFIRKTILIATGMNLFLTPFFLVGTPYIMRILLNSSDVLYGTALGIIQFSSIAGALSVAFIAKKLQISDLYKWLLGICVLMVPMAFAISPFMLGQGYASVFIAFFLCAIPIIMIITMLSVYFISVVQKHTPNSIMGKVMAIIMAVAQCAAPVGQLLYGQLFEHYQSNAYIVVAIMCLSVIVLAAFAKRFLKNEGGSVLDQKNIEKRLVQE